MLLFFGAKKSTQNPKDSEEKLTVESSSPCSLRQEEWIKLVRRLADFRPVKNTPGRQLFFLNVKPTLFFHANIYQADLIKLSLHKEVGDSNAERTT